MLTPVMLANGPKPSSCPARILTTAWDADLLSEKNPLAAIAFAARSASSIVRITLLVCAFTMSVFMHFFLIRDSRWPASPLFPRRPGQARFRAVSAGRQSKFLPTHLRCPALDQVMFLLHS